MPKLGKSFDSNASSGKPFRFKIGDHSVIQGWEKGLLGMKKQGSAKRFIVIPPQLAYGDKSIAGIPSNSTLCFQVELVKVSSRKSSASQPELPQQSVLQNTQSTPQQQQDAVKSRIAKIGFSLAEFAQNTPKAEEEMPMDAASFAMQNSNNSFVQASTSPASTPVVMMQQQSPQPVMQQPQPVVQTQPMVVQQPTIVQQQPIIQQQQQQQPILQQQPVVQQVVTPQPVAQQPAPASQSEMNVFQLLQQVLLQQKQAEQPQVQQQPAPVQAQQPAATPQTASPSLDKLTAKLDEIANKIDNLDFAKIVAKKSTAEDQKNALLSGPLLLQNVQHLVATSEQQQKDLIAEREKVDQLIEKLSTLRKRNERYAQEMSNHLNTSSVDTEYLHQELEHQQKQNQELKKKTASLQALIDTERSQQQELHNEITQLTSEKTALQKLNERNNQKYTKLELELKQQLADEQEKSERQFAQQVTNDKEKHQRLMEEIYDLKNKLTKANDQIQDKDKSLTDSAEQIKSRVEAAVAQREQQLRELYEKKLVELQELEVDKVKTQYESVVTDLQSKLRELSQQLNEKQSALDKAASDLETKIEEAENNKTAELKALFREQFQNKMKEVEEQSEQDQAELKTLFKQKIMEQRDQLEPAVKTLITKAFMSMKQQVASDKLFRGSKLLAALLATMKGSMKNFVDYVKAGSNLANYGEEEDEDEEDVTALSDDEDTAAASITTIKPASPIVTPQEEEEIEKPVAIEEPVKAQPEPDFVMPVSSDNHEEAPVTQAEPVKPTEEKNDEPAPVPAQAEIEKPVEEVAKQPEPVQQDPLQQIVDSAPVEQEKHDEPAPVQPEPVNREPPVPEDVDPLDALNFGEPPAEFGKTDEEPVAEPPKPVLTEEEIRIAKEKDMEKKKAKTAHLFADDDLF